MKYLIIVTGPTGIGKTSLSIQLAQHFNCDIISADSRQIYKEMSIGTAVPTEEELSAAQHHFIKHVSIHDYYNVSQYEHEAIALIEKLHHENDIVILTGGTGLYINAICKGIDIMPDPDPKIRTELNRLFEEEGIEKLQELLKTADPEYYKSVDLNNQARLIRALEMSKQTGKPYSSFRKSEDKKRNFEFIKIALNTDRTVLYDRINKRVDLMVADGLVEEAKNLIPNKDLTALKTVGYQELFEAFSGKITIPEGIEKIKNSSRRYARKQISWIRRDKDFHWFENHQIKEIIEHIKARLN